MLTMGRDAWELLLQKTKLYAAGHVARWHWRGAIGGVLPDGFDPDTLASEAILELLRHPPTHAALSPNDTGPVQRDLERRVRRSVNRLHHRIENRLLRNEPDLAPTFLDDGEPVRLIDIIPDPSLSPDNALLEKESLANFEIAKARFSNSIQGDPRLKSVFDLLCDDIAKPSVLSHRLDLPLSTIHNLRKQLRRRCRSRFRS